MFWDEEKKLGKALLLHGDEPAPVSIRLEPLGSVAGVSVDAGGRARGRCKASSARQRQTGEDAAR